MTVHRRSRIKKAPKRRTRIEHAFKPGLPPASSSSSNVDLVIVAAGSLLALAMAILQLPVPVRLLVGIAAALILPGYAIGMALFPPGKLDGVERAALAFSLSIGVLVVQAPILNLTARGLTAEVVTEAVTAVTLLATAAAFLRRRRLAAWHDAPAGTSSVRVPPRVFDRRWAVVPFGLIMVVLVAFLTGTLGAARPLVTEFFILGPGGTAGGLPARVAAGVPTTVLVGISNEEASVESYTVVVESASARLATAGPFTVESGATSTNPIAFTIPAPGNSQEIRILLFKGSDSEPYRSLRLVIDAFAP